MATTLDMLERLIGFDTTSHLPNRALIDWCAEVLESCGARVTLIEAEGGRKANLYATLGPEGVGGVMLSGHTDVVPVEGQDWSVPPFALSVADGRAYGRGTTDMKGFVASVLAMAQAAGSHELRTPLHIALSHDEEVGCIGVRSLIDMLAAAPVRPLLCIVGEPTGLAVATGHKGKGVYRAVCTGRAGHSSLAPLAVNAIHLGADLVTAMRAEQDLLAAGPDDPSFDVGHTTIHVGQMAGGRALNIVPDRCEILFEIRNLARDDRDAILTRIRARADAIAEGYRTIAPEAGIAIETTGGYPGLDTPEDAAAVAFVRGLTGANETIKVAYGTEGGLFAARLGVPTVVCGPGDIGQAHRPDEYVTLAQLDRCDAMLAALLARLVEGVPDLPPA